MYKIRPAKKCGYKGKIESTKHSGGNSNKPEKVDRTRREDARRETTRVSTYIPASGKTKYRSSQKEMERPDLGRELKNTGSIRLFPNSSRRRRRR
jgi:hypothetical protein